MISIWLAVVIAYLAIGTFCGLLGMKCAISFIDDDDSLTKSECVKGFCVLFFAWPYVMFLMHKDIKRAGGIKDWCNEQ